MTLPSILLPGKAAGLTSYFSPLYLVLFLPVVLVVYSVLPQKGRRWWLLAASYGFFWLISGGLAVYLLVSTAVMYWVGKRLTAIQQEQKALETKILALNTQLEAAREQTETLKNGLFW